ncbi:hypothetical protein U9M48_003994 [Paspalum notatum var. saurae]|uniref:Uncharacterized protein n=1 Tax=Paspalum notatum var. saurae TaxID=547442 RepID=A0AAQ3PM11_PASNO
MDPLCDPCPGSPRPVAPWRPSLRVRGHGRRPRAPCAVRRAPASPARRRPLPGSPACGRTSSPRIRASATDSLLPQRVRQWSTVAELCLLSIGGLQPQSIKLFIFYL